MSTPLQSLRGTKPPLAPLVCTDGILLVFFLRFMFVSARYFVCPILELLLILKHRSPVPPYYRIIFTKATSN